MPQGEPEEVIQTEKPAEETVLSQTTNEAEVKPEVETPVAETQERTPEAKEQARKWAPTRLAQREWKRKIAELRNNPESILEEVAKRNGFDTSDEKNKQQISFQAQTQKALNQGEDGIRNEYSNKVLVQTFKEMGIDPFSPQGKILGKHLFETHGTENPDIYSDQDVVKKAQEDVRNFFSPATKKSGVADAIARKAAAPQPKTMSKTPGSNIEDPRVSDISTRMMVSKESAKTIADLKLKIPKGL